MEAIYAKGYDKMPEHPKTCANWVCYGKECF
jgi:hypothetical protein